MVTQRHDGGSKTSFESLASCFHLFPTALRSTGRWLPEAQTCNLARQSVSQGTTGELTREKKNKVADTLGQEERGVRLPHRLIQRGIRKRYRTHCCPRYDAARISGRAHAVGCVCQPHQATEEHGETGSQWTHGEAHCSGGSGLFAIKLPGGRTCVIFGVSFSLGDKGLFEKKCIMRVFFVLAQWVVPPFRRGRGAQVSFSVTPPPQAKPQGTSGGRRKGKGQRKGTNRDCNGFVLHSHQHTLQC